MKTFLLAITAYVLLGNPLYAQYSEWGIDLAIGSTTQVNWLEGPLPSLFKPIGEVGVDLYFANVGADYFRQLGNEHLFVSAGLNYTYRKAFYGDQFHLVKLPIGLETRWGKNTKFVIGGTLHASYLLGISYYWDHGSNIILRRNFLFGAGGKLGVLFPLNDAFSLEMGYRSIFDLQPSYWTTTVDGSRTTKYRIADASIYFTLRKKMHTSLRVKP